jgi:hypothetical protein
VFDPRSYLYDAQAVAIGGQITRPKATFITSGASVALSGGGGLASAEIENYKFGDLIRIGHARSLVSGSLESDGSFNTLATVIMNDVSVQGVFSAKELVMRLTVHHTLMSDKPELKISPVGSFISGVRIAGVPIDVNPPVCDPDGIHGDIIKAFAAQDFAGMTKEEQAKLAADYKNAKPAGGFSVPRAAALQCLSRKFKKDYDFAPYRDYALVGSAFQFDPKCPFRRGKRGDVLKQNEFYVPNFGKIILGEYIVYERRQRLSLFRMELGSPDEGNPEGGGGGTGGHYAPPPM